jgi:hypothetical protein
MTMPVHRRLLIVLALGLSGCTANVGDEAGSVPAAVIDARAERDAARQRMVEMQRRAAGARAEANELAAELKLLRAEHARRLEENEIIRLELDDALADLDDADEEIDELAVELDQLMEEPWRTPFAWNELRAWMTPDEVIEILGHPAHIEPADDDETASLWFYGPDDDGYVTIAASDTEGDRVSEIVPPAY